jgi:hypothetical protein
MATVIKFDSQPVSIGSSGLAPGERLWVSFDPHPTHNNGTFIVTADGGGRGGKALWVHDMSVVRHITGPGDIDHIKTGVDRTVINDGSETIPEVTICLTRITP